MKFSGKRVLVTGAGANIGRAIALQFAAEGARLVVAAHGNMAGAKGVVEEIQARGGEASAVAADLTIEEEVDRLFATGRERLGGLDILVNNAGAALPTPFAASSLADWRRLFDINLFSAVLCSQRGAALMASEGAIINTASVRGVGHGGRVGIMAYSAAKAAIISFTKTLAKELAPGITVNAVAPGFVLTTVYDTVAPEVKEQFLESTLIKRWIDPDELAEAYLYLAGQAAVTGTVLTVDGGFLLKQG